MAYRRERTFPQKGLTPHKHFLGWEMAGWVKCLPWKCEELSLDLLNQVKPVARVHTSIPVLLRGGGGIPRSLCATQLGVYSYLSESSRQVKPNPKSCHLTHTRHKMHAPALSHINLHTYMNTCCCFLNFIKEGKEILVLGSVTTGQWLICSPLRKLL